MSEFEPDKKAVKEAGNRYAADFPSRDETDPEAAADQAFIDRMLKCAERAGNVSALARKAGLSQSGMRRYFNGGDPSRKVLIAIANAAEVNFLWLATGEGAMSGSMATSVPSPELLRLAVETVEEALAAVAFKIPSDRRRIAPQRKAEMVSAVYTLFAEGNGKLEKDAVLRLVKAAF